LISAMDTYNIEGKIVKEDDRYIVKDNTSLNNLVISTTTLHLTNLPVAISMKVRKKSIYL